MSSCGCGNNMVCEVHRDLIRNSHGSVSSNIANGDRLDRLITLMEALCSNLGCLPPKPTCCPWHASGGSIKEPHGRDSYPGEGFRNDHDMTQFAVLNNEDGYWNGYGLPEVDE